MSYFADKKIYIIGALLIIIVIAYFLIDYQIKTTILREFKKIGERKNKKLKIQKMKQKKMAHMKQQSSEEPEDQQYDNDSYIDPAAKFSKNNNDDHHEMIDDDRREMMGNNMQQERLSKDNIYMRDLIDK